MYHLVYWRLYFNFSLVYVLLKFVVSFAFSGVLVLRKHLEKIRDYIGLGIEKLLTKLKYGENSE